MGRWGNWTRRGAADFPERVYTDATIQYESRRTTRHALMLR